MIEREPDGANLLKFNSSDSRASMTCARCHQGPVARSKGSAIIPTMSIIRWSTGTAQRVHFGVVCAPVDGKPVESTCHVGGGIAGEGLEVLHQASIQKAVYLDGA